MPLSFSKDSHTTLNGTLYKATGSNGEAIVVEASHEAVQDYGEGAVQQKASDKYDAGLVNQAKVIVRTSDFT